MFTYLKLKNFKSFGDVTFDFKRTKHPDSVKSFVAVYGENGSGKSNFVNSVDLLFHTLVSFDRAKQFDDIAEFIKGSEEEIPKALLEHLLCESDLMQYIASCRTIGSEELTEVEYGFILNGYEGYYRLSFDDKFRNELLYYFTGKQRGNLFNISVDNDDVITWKFNGDLFASHKAEGEIVDEIKKYWGKHTFLGIVKQQMKEKNDSYIRDNYSEYLLAVIEMFKDITLVSKTSNKMNTGILSNKPRNIPHDLSFGVIPRSEAQILKRAERILRDFFTQAYADIKDVCYETEAHGKDKVKYQLFVDKMIAGKVRRISFANESAGTQQVLEIVRMLLGLFCGVTVVYDEIDNGIHDVLLNQIINSLTGEINGQLIITTHNTMLLEEMDPQSAYVIQVDYMGNKEIRCMADFVQPNNNLRRKYVSGLFGGTPYIDGIDYDTIVQELEDYNSKEDD